MANALKSVILALIIVCGIAESGEAQRRTDRDDKFDDGRFWVGGVISNNLRFGGGTFTFGVSPMAGYEIVPNVSIGPFVRFDYYYERFLYTQTMYIRYSSLDIGPGIFARADLFRQFFVQAEYENGNLQRARYDNNGNPVIGSDGKVEKETLQQNFVYLGAGYTSGGSVQYGISLHYNVLDDAFSLRFPWDYRINLRFQLNSGKR